METRKHSKERRRSKSPYLRGNRYNRRSPERPRYNRFNRSRSRSRGARGRYDGRRRSRSESPARNNSTTGYLLQQQQQFFDFGNYIQTSSNSQFGMNYGGYEYPPAPTFSVPAPPGEGETWISLDEKTKREAAVAEEKKRQREGLMKQRDQYLTRSEKMKRELRELKQQKADLVVGHGKRSPSPKTNGFIKENEKLQSAISSKLMEIGNVIDMLNSLIKKNEDETKKIKVSKGSDSESSDSERIKSELLESMKRKKKEAQEIQQKFNYIIYDPELHWCKTCNVFPKTAKDYLIHLHSTEHSEKNCKLPNNAPWRESFQKTNEVSSHPNAPTKRAPIRGLQFFEPTTAWFCKLCELFMGDTFCASLHLKSEIHAEKYSQFLEKEPQFEEKWLELRKKAMEDIEANGKSNDKKIKKKKSKRDNKKDKKKRRSGKKRKQDSTSSESSSNSDSSTDSDDSKKSESEAASIRVQMRRLQGVKVENDDRAGKWTMVNSEDKPVPPPAPSISQNTIQEKKKDDQILGQWNKVEPIFSQEEKRLLENLKMKNQQKHVAEKEQEKIRNRDIRSRSREVDRRDRSRSRNDRDRRDRRRKSRSRSRRSRSRGRWSRSRSRSHGRYRRSRSRSRGRRRLERPVVNFPSEPRLPPLREEKKLPARSYVITKKEESSSNTKKIMPIIGKMPVFKKQLSEKKYEEPTETEKLDAVQEEKVEVKKIQDDTWDELMPDPIQWQLIMGPPPPPPIVKEPEVVPPGLDPDMDEDFIPKPISDAPIARKGPLPKDFQDTLNLLYDGDRPKPVIIEQKMLEVESEVLPVVEDGPQMMTAEEMTQHTLLYGGFYAHNADGTDPTESLSLQPSKELQLENANEFSEKNEDAKKEQKMEMDDLAMLGIDVNDVGSGLW